MIIRILLLLLIAFPALAERDRVVLCEMVGSTPTCGAREVTSYGKDVRVGVFIDDNTGCPDGATYSIQGLNGDDDYTGVNWFEFMVISTASQGGRVFDPAIYFPEMRAVPSDTEGCTSLEVNLWIERQ
jgi:hypothetical protein